MLETDLYAPIKRFLETQGYAVKAEIGPCDVVACRGAEPPVVVELKTSFSLELLFQAIDRQTVTDTVYMAIALPGTGRSPLWARRQRSISKLCRRLGLGLLTVGEGRVEVHLDPAPYQPRQNKRRQGLLLKEFAQRVGDPNRGGSTRRPIMTAYRQDALRCARFVDTCGGAKLSDIRKHTKVGRAAAILQRDVYGWFLRQARGTYGLSPRGRTALVEFHHALGSLHGEEGGLRSAI